MQKNHEEQIEKMRNATVAQPLIPVATPANQASKLVEQIQQRKLFFSKKTEVAATASKTTTLWKQLTFVDDSDGNMSAKLKRLMGMKEDPPAAASD